MKTKGRSCIPWLVALVAVLALTFFCIIWHATKYDEAPLRALESDPVFSYSPPGATGSSVVSRKDHLARVPPLDDFDEQPSVIEASVVRRIELDPAADVDQYLQARRAIIATARRSGWREQSDSFAKWTATRTIDGTPASLSIYYDEESWWSSVSRFTKRDLARRLRTSSAITISLEERPEAEVRSDAWQASSDRASNAAARSALRALSAEVPRVAAAIRASDGSPSAKRRIESAATAARSRLLEERARKMPSSTTRARLAADQLILLQLTQLTYVIRAAQADDPQDAATSAEAARAFGDAQRSLAGSLRARGLAAPRPDDYPRITGRTFSPAPRDASSLSDRQRYELAVTAILAEHQARVGLASGRDVFYSRSLGQTPRSKRGLRATANRLRTAAPPVGAEQLHRQLISAFDAAARAEALAREDEAAARRAEAGDGAPPRSSLDGRRTYVIERSNQMTRADDLVAQLKSRGYAIGVDRTAVQLNSGLRPPQPRYPEVYPP